MNEQKQYDDSINDGFPEDFDPKKDKITSNDGAEQQHGSADDYVIEQLMTINRERKHLPVYDCIGQMLMEYGGNDKNAVKDMTGGTGTVFKKLPNDYFLVLTAAHNLVRYTKVTKKREGPSGIWFFPKGSHITKCRLQFVAKEIYAEYKPEESDLCSGDLAVVLFHDKKGKSGLGAQHYNDVAVNDVIQISKWPRDEDPTLNLFGYPIKSEGLLQGQSGEADLKRDRGIWIYEDIYTFPGQSGAAIFKKMRKQKKYALYGVHTFGHTVKQENCGIFLDDRKREWIQSVVVKFEAFAKESKKDITFTIMKKQDEGKVIDQNVDGWLKSNNLMNAKHVFDKNNITPNELLALNEEELAEFAANNQLDTITTVRLTNAISQLYKNHSIMLNDDDDNQKCCNSITIKLFIFALVAVYDMIGDIGLPFTFPYRDCACYIGSCIGSYSAISTIYGVCCDTIIYPYRDHDTNENCNEACGTEIDFDNTWNYDIYGKWHACRSNDGEVFQACNDFCHLWIIIFCYIAMVFTVIKEVVKIFYTVQLLWNDHLMDICGRKCCKLETIAIWCKDSILFFLIILVKPSILNEMKEINERYGFGNKKVILLNLIMEDIWGILAAVLIIIYFDYTFWSIFSLIGSVLMVGKQLYNVK